MEAITHENIQVIDQPNQMVFIYSPFCGTCHLARQILEQLEEQSNQQLFYQLNASLFPTLMQQCKIEHVPCLAIRLSDGSRKKVYSFEEMAKLSCAWSSLSS